MSKQNKQEASSKSKRALSKKFHGSSTEGFGKKKKRSNRFRNFMISLTLVVAAAGLIWFTAQTWGVGNVPTTGLDNKEFDPIADFDVIRAEGNVAQLEKLMFDLKLRKIDRQSVPVQLDNSSKILQVAQQILDHDDRTENQRVLAARAKLDSIWRMYSANLQYGLNDPFVAEQFFGAADEFVDDEHPLVARDAYLSRARALVYETSLQKSLGSFEAVGKSIVDLIANYPEDRVVLENIRILFTQLRAMDADNSADLAGQIAAIADQSEFDETRKLSRFMKDIMALYDAGIGNLKTIASIIVDDDDFKERLKKLNDNVDTGETVVTQLDNAIEFYERQRKHDVAKEISQWVLDTAEQRTDPDAKKLAIEIGSNGVKRNSLLNQPWSFDGTDKLGVPIDTKRFDGRVVMLMLFAPEDPGAKDLLSSMSNLSTALFGKTVDFVVVEVGEGDAISGMEEFENSRWVVLHTTPDDPNGYFKQCPTIRLPYCILINKDGIVDSINLTMTNIKTKIENLLVEN